MLASIEDIDEDLMYTAPVTCAIHAVHLFNDYSESLKVITFMVFLFVEIEKCKSAPSEGGHQHVQSSATSVSMVHEVHKEMVATLREGVPSHSRLMNCRAAEFKHGREGVEEGRLPRKDLYVPHDLVCKCIRVFSNLLL